MDRILRAVSTKTARTTAIYYVSSFGLNILRYFFHLILMKFLAPSAYGEFLSYLSLQYLLGIPMGTIATLSVKTISEFYGKNDRYSLNAFFYYIIRLTLPISTILALALVLLAPFLASIFKASPVAFVVLGISVLISLFSTVIYSYILGFQKFIFQTVLGFIGMAVSLFLAVILIKFGYGATGAVIAQLLAGILVTLISFLKIRPSIIPAVTKVKKFTLDIKSLTGYSLFYSIGTLSLVSTDILTVRFLLSPTDSGLYSALSILGRMILFGLTPLIGIVLPIATHRHASSGSAKSVFLKIGAVLTLLGLIGSGLFSFFPTLFIRYLSGSSYISAAPLLPFFAFSMFFFALSQFIVSYLMATGRPKATILLIVASVAQPVLFAMVGFSISHVVMVNFFLHATLLISLIITYFRLSYPD